MIFHFLTVFTDVLCGCVKTVQLGWTGDVQTGRMFPLISPSQPGLVFVPAPGSDLAS